MLLSTRVSSYAESVREVERVNAKDALRKLESRLLVEFEHQRLLLTAEHEESEAKAVRVALEESQREFTATLADVQASVEAATNAKSLSSAQQLRDAEQALVKNIKHTSQLEATAARLTAEKSALQEAEKSAKIQIAEIKKELNEAKSQQLRQTAIAEKAIREVEKARSTLENQKRALETKLETAKAQLKSKEEAERAAAVARSRPASPVRPARPVAASPARPVRPVSPVRPPRPGLSPDRVPSRRVTSSPEKLIDKSPTRPLSSLPQAKLAHPSSEVPNIASAIPSTPAVKPAEAPILADVDTAIVEARAELVADDATADVEASAHEAEDKIADVVEAAAITVDDGIAQAPVPETTSLFGAVQSSGSLASLASPAMKSLFSATPVKRNSGLSGLEFPPKSRKSRPSLQGENSFMATTKDLKKVSLFDSDDEPGIGDRDVFGLDNNKPKARKRKLKSKVETAELFDEDNPDLPGSQFKRVMKKGVKGPSFTGDISPAKKRNDRIRGIFKV